MLKIYGTVLMVASVAFLSGMVVGGAITEHQQRERDETINNILVNMSLHYVKCVDELEARGGEWGDGSSEGR